MTRWFARIYRVCLRLAPSEFRRRYGDELVGVAVERVESIQIGRWRQAVRELMDLLVTVRRERRIHRQRTGRPGHPVLWTWLDRLGQDLRYAFRTIRRNPGFTCIAVLSLGFGIGANTSVFSIVNAVLLRPLPYHDADRLVVVWEQDAKGTDNFVAPADFQDWRHQSASFSRIAAFIHTTFTITGGDQPERVAGDLVSADLFDVLGVAPALGRGFGVEDERQVPYQCVVLSNGLWRRRFGGDPGVVGQTLESNGRRLTIVGVMPEGFDFPAGLIRTPPEMWVPLARPPQEWSVRDFHYLRVIGRLRDGVTLRSAANEIGSIQHHVAEDHPGSAFGSVRIAGLARDIVGDVRTPLLVILTAVLCVLLIACVNVANLMLARGSARQREFAVRMALGAGRKRVMKQLVTESLLLGMLGGALGMALAVAITRGILAIAPANLPHLAGVRMDLRALEFTLAVSVIAGVLCGTAPAVSLSARDVIGRLKEGGRGPSQSPGGRLRDGLVVSEIALAIVLVAGAALMVQSLYRLEQVQPGFRTENILTFSVALPDARYPSARQVRFWDDLVSRIRMLPGVQSVGGTSALPLSGTDETYSFAREGRVRSQASMEAHYQVVTLNYFKTLGIPLLRGRAFDERDNAVAARVVMINESFARRFFADEDAVGRRIEIGDGRNAGAEEVIGIVKDLNRSSLAETPEPEMYETFLQTPQSSLTLAVLAAGDPGGLLPAIRRQLALVDPDIPLSKVLTMSNLMDESLAPSRFRSVLMDGFASFALLLAAIGVYGVMAYNMSRRIAEVGIRVALGARPAQVLSLVIGQALRLAIVGVLFGLVAALWLTRFLKELLYGIGTTDPLTFAATGLILIVVAVGASYLPARRAMKIDPLVALRRE